jgi:hypothetical protein
MAALWVWEPSDIGNKLSFSSNIAGGNKPPVQRCCALIKTVAAIFNSSGSCCHLVFHAWLQQER